MKKAILWIHGWGTSSKVWHHDVRHQDSRHHDSQWMDITLELPGFEHVYADFSACGAPADLVSTIRDQLTRIQADEITLIGWSLGAMLAIEAIKSADPRISSIVIVSGTLKFTDADRSLGWPSKIVTRMRTKLSDNPQEVLKQFAASMLTSEQFPDWGSYLQRLEPDYSPAGLEAGLTYLIETDLRSEWDQINKINPAVLWIHGSQDTICPIRAMPASLSAQASFVIEAAGHVPFLTDHKLFYEQLRRFLQ